MSEHECVEIDYCTCSAQGFEPHEGCPYHGGGPPWPPKCVICGRFLSYSIRGPQYAPGDDELLECSRCGWTGTELAFAKKPDDPRLGRHQLDDVFCPGCGADENNINTQEVEDDN